MSDSDGSMTVEGALDRAAMYRAAIETSTDGFHLLDGEGRILEVNNAYLQRSGYTREELLGMRVDDLDARESPGETAAHIRRVRSEGSDIFETLHRTRDGRLWQVEITVSYWDIEGGRFFCFLRDIAGRKRSEALLRTRVELSALAESGTIDDLLQHALDAAELHTGSNIGFFHFVDRDQQNLTLQTWSTNTLKSMCTATGKGKGKHYPISEAGVWVECFHRKEPVIHNDYEALPQRKGMPSGHAPVMRELVVPLMREGRVAAIIGVGNKTTDYLPEDVQSVEEIASLVMDSVIRKRVEAELRESQERLSRAQHVARLGNWEWDFLANRWYWSEVNYRIFGVAPRIEPSYDVFIGTVKPAERELVNQAFADALAGKRRFNIDYTIIRPDSGQPRIINSKADVIRDAKGSPIRMVGTVQDITRRKKVEDALRHSESLYHDLVETAQDLIWQCDAEGRYTYLNPAWEAVFGYPVKEMLGRKFTDFQDPVTARHDQQAFMSLLEGGLVKGYETVHRSRDGHDIHLVFNAKCVRDAAGSIVGTRGTAYDITARKAVEEHLRKNEALLSQSQFVARVGHYVLNLPEGSWSSSEMLDEIFGIGPDFARTVEGWLTIVHPDQRQEMLEYFRDEVLRDRKPFDREYRIVRVSDNTPLWVHGLGNLEYADDGRPLRMFGIIQDITERRKAKEALLESEGRFRSIYKNIGIGVALIGKNMEILSINPQMQQWFPHIDACRHPTCFQSFNTPPRYSICEYCPTVQTLQDGQVHRAVTDTPTAGGIRHYQVISTPLLAADGSVSAAIEMVEDITERTRSEAKLRKSERQLAESQQVARIGSWSWDVVHNTLDWSDETFRRFDKDPDTFTPSAEYYMSLIHPDDRASIVRAIQDTLEHDAPYHIQARIINESGREWVLEGFGIVERDAEGKPLRLAGTVQDITERRIAEDKVRQSEKFVRSLLDTVDEGFIVIDRDYRILTANKAYCSQVGGCDETVIGSHCYEISHKIDRPCYEEGEECAVRQVFDSGQPHASLHRHRDAHGNIIYVETKAYPILDAAGGVSSVIETISNITEKYLLEEERLKTQKLESIGTLAGGIAHDFNNLLQGVFGYISMAKMTLDQRERALKMLEQAEEALHLSVNLTTQLLTFSKGGKPVKKLISLRPAIENAVKFALSGSHTDYRLDIAPDVWQVEADTGQLAQVIQNIVLNANEAMAGSGTVCISVANMQVPSKAGSRLPKGGRFVRIDITDTGTGISGQNLARIFDPYFTTKQKGSGLGLATSYSIIRNHGGVIEVTSELEKGSTFTLYLPAATAVDPKPGPPPAAVAGMRKGRILVMDDEDLVRKIAVEMIAALGHEVSSAVDGVKAIELFRQARETGAPYDLLILDLTVKGGMGGEEAIQRILEMDPGAKAVVSSGYADNPVVSNYRDHGFSAFLNKPYKLAALQECLDSCLS